MPHLRVTHNQQTTIITLRKQLVSLGSSAQCDVPLRDTSLPGQVAAIHQENQQFTLIMMDGKDAIVNGRKRRKHRLVDGDKLQIGTCELSFWENEASPEKPAVVVTKDVAAQSLYEFSAKLMHEKNVNDLLGSLLDSIVELAGANKGFIILTENGHHEIKVARNFRRENLADAVSELSDSILAKAVKTLEPVILTNAMEDQEFGASQSVMHLKLSSVMCFPMLDRGQLIGLIYVGSDNPTRQLDQDGVGILRVYTAQAALIIKSALLLDELRIDRQSLMAQLADMHFGEIIATSPIMQSVLRKVEKVAPTDISVLISGETGTGKELLARELHRRSRRKDGPFVAINCGAIPEALLESELFGHVRGAFTGAVNTKNGTFQAAAGGTLFLDEIGEMPVALQVKILRAIQERVICKVGDTKNEHIDIRIVAASHRDLQQAISTGHFREDLFYRLNVVNLQLPALRERGEDILTLARFLLGRTSQEYQSIAKGFSAAAVAALRKHPWPGNIRELENRIKKAAVLAETPLLSPEDLGLTEGESEVLPLAQAKEKFQREYISEVLALNGGNRTKTARDLGVDPRTIFRHLERDEEERV